MVHRPPGKKCPYAYVNKMGVSETSYLQVPEPFRIQINAQLLATIKPTADYPV